MSITNIDHFNRKDCEKIDPNCINAYMDFHVNPENDTAICIDTSWGQVCIDLDPIVKKAQTCTSLYLSPQPDPNCLVYEGECETFCITGDELSRIISMTKLKDVDQTTPPRQGDVYLYDGNQFVTFNLSDALNNLDIDLSAIWAAIHNLQHRMDSVENRVTNIENTIAPIVNRWQLPDGVPDDAKILLGNINLYSDYNASINSGGAVTSLNKNHGIYGHSLNVDKNYDEIFG